MHVTSSEAAYKVSKQIGLKRSKLSIYSQHWIEVPHLNKSFFNKIWMARKHKQHHPICKCRQNRELYQILTQKLPPIGILIILTREEAKWGRQEGLKSRLRTSKQCYKTFNLTVIYLLQSTFLLSLLRSIVWMISCFNTLFFTLFMIDDCEGVER
jgi:hypothetical protein